MKWRVLRHRGLLSLAREIQNFGGVTLGCFELSCLLEKETESSGKRTQNMVEIKGKETTLHMLHIQIMQWNFR